MKRTLALPILIGNMALVVSAHAQNLHWASKPADSQVLNSAAVLGQPDGVATSVAFYGFAYVRDFQPGRVTAAQIERGLGLPAGELARWDIIAFQGNSAGSTRPFDSSMWMVQDMRKLTSVVYDSSTGAAVEGTGLGWRFRSGYLPNEQYRALFPGNRYSAGAGWILIKLPPGVVNKASPNLAIWLGGGPMPGTNNLPAPDAIGVIR
jgi:hypothetical protein